MGKLIYSFLRLMIFRRLGYCQQNCILSATNHSFDVRFYKNKKKTETSLPGGMRRDHTRETRKMRSKSYCFYRIDPIVVDFILSRVNSSYSR